MQKLSNFVFISYYPENLPGPLTPPFPLNFTFLPVKTSRSRCCYLPGFQQPVTSTSISLPQKLSHNTFLDALPAVPDTCWEAQSVMSNFEKKRNQHKGQNDGRKEREHMSERLRGATEIGLLFIFFLMFPKLTLLIFLT